MVFPGFYEASGTSTRNHPSEPTASKPVVPGMSFSPSLVDASGGFAGFRTPPIRA
jgi:hypothetical protein